MTLEDYIRLPIMRDCKKHGLAPDPELYADKQINEMTQAQFLSALSFALERWKEEK